MNAVTWSVVIAAAGFVFSMLGAAFLSGLRWGSVQARLDTMERNITKIEQNSATRDQLSGVKEDLAEIKGMFRMVPKEGTG